MNPNALNPATSTSSQYDEAFIPRLGIVYQPVEPVSLYASYAESFLPSNAADAQGLPLEPERGQQFEVGVRAELLEGRLVANLALFDLTKQNVDRKSTRLNSSHRCISYAVFCLKKKKHTHKCKTHQLKSFFHHILTL